MTELNFYNKTIGELAKMTEDYEKLQIENIILRTKYLNKIKQSEKQTAQDLIEELE